MLGLRLFSRLSNVMHYLVNILRRERRGLLPPDESRHLLKTYEPMRNNPVNATKEEPKKDHDNENNARSAPDLCPHKKGIFSHLKLDVLKKLPYPLFFFFLRIRRPPTSPLFPTTTLFR